ncbi:D-methionine transport system permease protein [Clostridium cavendishii DSM 21758]|uniref:D-methionine transport system permease protein n=1 Tax=Clostridium cavendishii DSM 21758 TaxID=1121302 RepID=A0A1M6BH16_9CLOT|nr:methionine ABC transporter permease [Clostridium cavendishii]SHI47763.1 D-methionine transport system permease protein [Clostridium cavendishii DSM 21758]
MNEILIRALKETAIMISLSTIFAVIIGFIPAVVLILTAKDGLKPNKLIYSVLDFVVNTLRSFPFIILMVLIMPLTKIIVGTSIGTPAAIIPLTIGSAPFVTRVIEGALREVDKGVIEAAKSFGASNSQIIFKVMLKEAMPAIMSGITLTIISIVGYSAMAGAIGAGGLGDAAIKYGYLRNKKDILFYTVIVLIILVQFLQGLGDLIYKKLSK